MWRAARDSIGNDALSKAYGASMRVTTLRLHKFVHIDDIE